MRREQWCWSSRVHVFEFIYIWTTVRINSHTRGLTCIPVSRSLPAASTLCPHTDYPKLPILILHTSLSPSLTDLASPLTPASLLKLGALVITTLSPLTHLSHTLLPSSLWAHALGSVANPAQAVWILQRWCDVRVPSGFIPSLRVIEGGGG